MQTGYLALVLNAHLPFVRRPDLPKFLEERWYFEALSETYLPLLRLFRRLDAEGTPFTLTLSLSPTLAAMLGDGILSERYCGYLNSQLALAAEEIARTAEDRVFAPLAKMYEALYREDLADFEELYGRDILGAFDYYYKKGRIELITTAATHTFLPIYRSSPEAISAQIETALVAHRGAFGKHPIGFWLPQLGFFPGVEEALKAYNIQYTVITTRGGLLGAPPPRAGSYEPVRCPNGLMVFIRDVAATDAVWSESSGYPADPVYRDFYRDSGYDLPFERIEPWMEAGTARIYTGFKYWAVTGHTEEKRPYDQAAAMAKTQAHAADFIDGRLKAAKAAQPYMKRPPLMVCPYDAELFGHWWFEGPLWLEALFRQAALVPEMKFLTLGEYQRLYPEAQTSMPEYSSWADGGFGEVWLDGENDWIYRHCFKAVERMAELAERFADESGLRERILNQAAREVLLAMCSDWALLMRTNSSRSFARSRVAESIENFDRIYEMLSSNTVDTEWLTSLEKRDNIFPSINYRIFRKKR